MEMVTKGLVISITINGYCVCLAGRLAGYFIKGDGEEEGGQQIGVEGWKGGSYTLVILLF